MLGNIQKVTNLLAQVIIICVSQYLQSTMEVQLYLYHTFIHNGLILWVNEVLESCNISIIPLNVGYIYH